MSLEHLPLVLAGMLLTFSRQNVLVVDFAQEWGGHGVMVSLSYWERTASCSCFIEYNYFFRIQRPAVLRDQKPDIIFRQIRKGVR